MTKTNEEKTLIYDSLDKHRQIWGWYEKLAMRVQRIKLFIFIFLWGILLLTSESVSFGFNSCALAITQTDQESTTTRKFAAISGCLSRNFSTRYDLFANRSDRSRQHQVILRSTCLVGLRNSRTSFEINCWILMAS